MLRGLRYYLTGLGIKYLTPSLWEKLKIMDYIGIRFQYKGLWFQDKLPRPMIEKVKRLYGARELIGAEIGVRYGRNAKNILKELNMRMLYLIDPWENYEGYSMGHPKAYQTILKRFGKKENICILKDYSFNVIIHFANCSLDFVYIDGNHNYEYIYRDLDLYYEKVKPFGVIGGHDAYNKSDVLKAVYDWCVLHKKRFELIPPDWYIIKKEGLNEI